MNRTLIDALHCRNEAPPPIWLMRQAGRYLPEYRQLKGNRKLFDLFHDPEMVVRITKLPLEILPLDAAILFSDILTVLDGLGVAYDFQEGIGPIIETPITSHLQLKNLYQQENVYFAVKQAIVELKKSLNVPLLGFAGAPFTIACYLIEGRSSQDHKKTKQWLFRDPLSFQILIDKITDAIIDYLNCQIDAGVDGVQIFDSWANTLNIWDFRQFCLKPMERIVQAIKKRKTPVILFCRGSSLFARDLASISPSAISVDWSGDIVQIRSQIPSSIAIQGNLDPMVLYGSHEVIQKATDRILHGLRDDPGFIFNLGHGLLPDIPVDNVKFLIHYVKNYYVQKRPEKRNEGYAQAAS